MAPASHCRDVVSSEFAAAAAAAAQVHHNSRHLSCLFAAIITLRTRHYCDNVPFKTNDSRSARKDDTGDGFFYRNQWRNQGRRSWGVRGLDLLEMQEGTKCVFDPQNVTFFHSKLLLDNSASLTSRMNDLRQKWTVRLILEAPETV